MAALALAPAAAPPQPSPAAPVATLTGITKRFGSGGRSILALNDLSLALHPGEIVALLGPNGAGKSTAVRTLLGLSAPTTGQARIFGADPRHPATRTRIGAMLQVASVPKTLTVREHIDLFRSYYPAPLPYAEIVRIAQLSEIEDRRFEVLSGGQRQRLLFGLALAGDPEIIFLDEPTVGLDIEARRGLWQQIRALAARGKTILLTTHYLEEADALAHRIIVINKGRIVREGTPAQIKNLTATRTIRCCTALSTAQLWTIPSVTDVVLSGEVTTLTVGNPETVLRELLAWDETICGIEVVAPNLEDAFLALTTH